MSPAPLPHADPPLRHLALAGGALAYADEGAGPPLLALHGMPGSHRDFRHLAPGLSQGLRLLRVDLPGFGQSPAALAPPDKQAINGLLLRFLDALGIERVRLMGHSFGGGQALSLAAAAPDRVAGLVLLASIGARPHAALRRLPSPRRLSGALETPVLSSLVRPLLRRAFAATGFRRVSDAEIHRCMAVLAGWDWASAAADIAAVSCPTLVAGCLDDVLVEPAILDDLSAALPPGPRLRLATGGHGLIKGQAPALIHAILESLPAMR